MPLDEGHHLRQVRRGADCLRIGLEEGHELLDLVHVRNLYGWVAINVANTVVLYAMALVMLFRLDAKLTLIALAPYLAATWAMKRFGRRMHEESTAAQAALAVERHSGRGGPQDPRNHAGVRGSGL